MNLSQLETLLTISKTMSFRKAGDLLNLTQPAVSAQIKSLEDEFNAVLIDRNQPVTLTDNGRVFLEHAERILDIIEELKKKLSDLHHTPQGHIVLGTTSSIAIQILPRVLAYFQNLFPRIKSTIHSMPSSQVISSVENGSVDLGITYLSERHSNLETSVLYYDSFALVVPPGHPLTHVKNPTIELLRDLPLIMLSPDTLGRRFLNRVLQDHGIVEPNIVMELSSSEEVKRMVEIHLGAAVVSRMSITNELEMGTLQMIKIAELAVNHPVGIVYRSGRYLSSTMQQFLNDLKDMRETHFI